MSDSYDNLFTPEEASRRVVVIASNNDHKVAEIRDILSDVLPGMDFKPMREIGGFPVPEETGSTFEENAFIKAEAIHNLTMMPVIADACTADPVPIAAIAAKSANATAPTRAYQGTLPFFVNPRCQAYMAPPSMLPL